MKILHSADLHLGAPFSGRTEEQAQFLRRELLAVPGKLATLCRREGCGLMLLAGDLFDSPNPDRDSVNALRDALEEAAVPVFISPGNHDFCGPASPYLTEPWPGNVHIFTRLEITSVALPDLGCRVYGAGYTAMDCPGLLEGFAVQEEGLRAVGVFHGDPTRPDSPYCPVTAAQAARTGLSYLALGHIHQGGGFRSGGTLCAWPGCPMGRGFDETGEKGALIVALDGGAEVCFTGLEVPRFYDETADAAGDAAAALGRLLPGGASADFWRVTLTGESELLDLAALAGAFPRVPNLELRDRTELPIDLWAGAGEGSLQGTYFRILREALAEADEERRRRILLAARISRKILAGQEVELP